MKGLSILFLISLLTVSACKKDYSSTEWQKWKKDSVEYFPRENWMAYATPEEAGWSSAKLNDAKHFFDKSSSSALMVIYNGNVLANWGETNRKFMIHSMRKSLINGLYGLNNINTAQSLKSLGINDIHSLTEEEQKATVENLLMSRSGIYLPAAYELPGKKKPERGSYKPGENWFYNNWDFNVLGTILEKETGKTIESEFEQGIALPISMDDFNGLDVYTLTQQYKSLHPAHIFKMSARDLARYGLLFLNKGKWEGNQIIPKEWVKKSTTPYSISQVGDYGYLWWVSNNRFKDLNTYYASGLNGQRLFVIPEANLVVVSLTDTYAGNNISEDDIYELLDNILSARISQPNPKPSLVSLDDQVITTEVRTMINFDSYLGDYMAPANFDKDMDSISMVIRKDDLHLIAEIEYFGFYELLPKSKEVFLINDMNFPLNFEFDHDRVVGIRFKAPLILKEINFRKKN